GAMRRSVWPILPSPMRARRGCRDGEVGGSILGRRWSYGERVGVIERAARARAQLVKTSERVISPRAGWGTGSPAARHPPTAGSSLERRGGRAAWRPGPLSVRETSQPLIRLRHLGHFGGEIGVRF